MDLLDALLPTPRLLETTEIEVGANADRAWTLLRHGDLARSKLIKALFWVRTLPSTVRGEESEKLRLRVDDLQSSPERPGFQVLLEDPPSSFAVGAIGKVWRAEIPFVHVASGNEFAAFDRPDYVKVAWAIRVVPLGEGVSRIELEVRVDATDDEAWKKFRRYFRVIGPASRFIRQSLLADLRKELGTPEARESERPLPGDELLEDAAGALTHAITIDAPPATVWPWLVQMGARRAGYYSIDLFDHGGRRSAREIHPEWQEIAVGDVLPATDTSDDGFEVLRLEENRLLVLGGLYDGEAHRQLPFHEARPSTYWHVTWAFVLEPVGEGSTRLVVRARAAFPESKRLHAQSMRILHPFMERAQLRHLAARAEGRLPRDDARAVFEGLAGAGITAAALFTPFLRARRMHWGLSSELAARVYPGDERLSEPGSQWTHAIEIDAPPHEVWPWIAQIGADRGGFYSYQWLENIVGCEVRNAETVHPEWQVKVGDSLLLHPKGPPLPIVEAEPNRYFLTHAPASTAAREENVSFVEATWLFFLEPIESGRTRFISRYRVACSDDFATKLVFTSPFIESIGFAMDRRMLIGVKRRVEASRGSG